MFHILTIIKIIIVKSKNAESTVLAHFSDHGLFIWKDHSINHFSFKETTLLEGSPLTAQFLWKVNLFR